MEKKTQPKDVVKDNRSEDNNCCCMAVTLQPCQCHRGIAISSKLNNSCWSLLTRVEEVVRHHDLICKDWWATWSLIGLKGICCAHSSPWNCVHLAIPTTMFDTTPFSVTFWWTFIPSSKLSIVALLEDNEDVIDCYRVWFYTCMALRSVQSRLQKAISALWISTVRPHRTASERYSYPSVACHFGLQGEQQKMCAVKRSLNGIQCCCSLHLLTVSQFLSRKARSLLTYMWMWMAKFKCYWWVTEGVNIIWRLTID